MWFALGWPCTEMPYSTSVPSTRRTVMVQPYVRHDGSVDEVVALYDEAGRVVGSAPRSRVRAENLRHGGTAIIVRNSLGQVYVHRRTDTKDVFPGMYDLCAGGVLLAGEDPLNGATREVAEELGVTGVPLRPVLRTSYADEHTTYEAFGYEVTYDGPIVWQPSEVASGDWVEMTDLADRLAEPSSQFVPDSRTLVGSWVRERAADRRAVGDGWDSVAEVVEGRWIDRAPRRAEVAGWLRAETRLLPLIAGQLPLQVPVPAVVRADPLVVRHVSVPGAAVLAERLDAVDGERVGAFLRALHGVRSDEVVAALATGRSSVADQLAELDDAVLPLLGGERRAGRRLLDELADAPGGVLVHGDLGPEHLLVAPGEQHVTGVIDWSDARLGDPALDLAWVLHATPVAFADALAAAYGVDTTMRDRALLWHRLGPWHEALHGLRAGRPDLVASGLAGARARLP